MKPQIVTVDQGYNNKNIEQMRQRLENSKSYKDLSTIIVCPTRGVIPAKVVQSWMSLIRPMNQKVIGPLFAIGMEVGAAYENLFEMILDNPELSQWKYILTIEEDNIPPPDGLLKLYENMDRFDVIGGLYWTKGELGQPMIYGDPGIMPKNFIPQQPRTGQIQPANGLGMGFNLFKIESLKKVPRPWFKTLQEFDRISGARVYTQDLYFYERGAKEGLRYACDCRILVGHLDYENDRIW